MAYLTRNIDRAIVLTQYDLRGFAHPIGARRKGLVSPKNLDAITGNLTACAAGFSGEEGAQSTDESWVSYWEENTFEDLLTMYQRLHEDCDLSQREAIQLIVLEIVRKSVELKAEVASGERRQSSYLQPLDKTNRWGAAILALAEAFEVELELEEVTA